MKRLLLTALLLLIFIQYSVSQNFSNNQKEEIQNNAREVIEQFASYVNLIGDKNEPDANKFNYTEKLLKLFYNKEILVFNDLEPDQKSGKDLTILQYREYLDIWYTTNFSTEISNLVFENMGISQNNLPYITVFADKSVSGVLNGTTPNQNTKKVEFRIIFDPKTLAFSTFKIARLSKKVELKPGPVKGKVNANVNEIIVYQIDAVPDAESYIWTLPDGFLGVSTQPNIKVKIEENAKSGKIVVRTKLKDEISEESSLFVKVERPIPDIPGTISGKATVSTGEKGIFYTIPIIKYADEYVWTLPAGFAGKSNSNTIQVSFDENAKSGMISVAGKNEQGTGSPVTLNISVEKPLPEPKGKITGRVIVNPGEKGVAYTVPEMKYANGYFWIIPRGFNGTSNTNTILIDFDENAKSGIISVAGKNERGQGPSISQYINVDWPLPEIQGKIIGKSAVIAGEKNIEYTVPEIKYADQYVWTLPVGFIGNSNSNTIQVSFGENARSGVIKVAGKNSRGEGKSTSFSIDVSPLKTTPSTIVKENKVVKENDKGIVNENVNKMGMGKAAISSLLLPGLGQTKLSGGKPFWIIGIIGYGCLGGAVYMNLTADKNYQNYLKEPVTDTRTSYYNNSVNQDKTSKTLAIAGAGLWAGNLIWTIIKANSVKKSKSTSLINPNKFNLYYSFDTEAQKPLLTVKYSFY